MLYIVIGYTHFIYLQETTGIGRKQGEKIQLLLERQKVFEFVFTVWPKLLTTTEKILDMNVQKLQLVICVCVPAFQRCE